MLYRRKAQKIIVMDIKTKYFIDYVYSVDAYGKQSFYYQLTRTRDNAILYVNEQLENVELECWKREISCKDVIII